MIICKIYKKKRNLAFPNDYKAIFCSFLHIYMLSNKQFEEIMYKEKWKENVVVGYVNFASIGDILVYLIDKFL